MFKEPEEKSIKDEEELFQLNTEHENARPVLICSEKLMGNHCQPHYELSKAIIYQSIRHVTGNY